MYTAVKAEVVVLRVHLLRSRVDAWCKRNGWTLADLARRMGVSRQSLHQMLDSESVRVETLRALSAAMGVGYGFWKGQHDLARPDAGDWVGQSARNRIRRQVREDIAAAVRAAEEKYGKPEEH